MSELKAFELFGNRNGEAIGIDKQNKTLNLNYKEVYLKSEADKVIAELKSDYKEACGRLQTANLIKDEQLAATRHQKYKRCLDKAKYCETQLAYYIASAKRYDIKYVNRKCGHFYRWKYRWMELAVKFKEVK